MKRRTQMKNPGESRYSGVVFAQVNWMDEFFVPGLLTTIVERG
jgi:hypothetical protein